MEKQPVLKVDNLKTVLDLASGTVPVVDGVSFSVGVGETLGIVGESGSGKSMTALSIMRVLPRPIGRIASGSILLRGEDLIAKSEKQMSAIRGSKLGMILQDPHTSLNPVISARLQLCTSMRLCKRSVSCRDTPGVCGE